MSEVPVDPIANKAFVIRGEDGVNYAGAEELPNACVCASAIFLAGEGRGYAPSVSVIEVATGTVHAIIGVPTVPPNPRPSLHSLEPNVVTFPAVENVTLRCLGTDFDDGAVIVFNGSDEPTTFVSGTEVTTGIDVSTIQAAISVPVFVRNPDGQTSEVLTLTFEERTP